MEAFSARAEQILQLAQSYGIWWLWFCYLFLFISAIAESLFPPYPGDAVTFAGGYLASLGKLNFPLVLLATSLGSLTGMLLLHTIGKRYGRRIFGKGKRWWISPGQLTKIEQWFTRYGVKVILLSRFLSGIRSVIALSAGIGNVPRLAIILYGSLSIILWNSLLLVASHLVEQNWRQLYHLFGVYNTVVFSVLLFFALGFLFWFFRKQQRVQKGV